MSDEIEVNDDGSMKGVTFTEKSESGYKGEHPTPKGGETYREFHDRVVKCKEQGFHLGDLSWANWECYCLGFGRNEEYRQDEVID
jgi:hypothetical protein